MKRKRPNKFEGVRIHDHFDGSAHCVQCGGECRLEGAEFFATHLVRLLLDRVAMRGGGLNMLEDSALREAGVDPAAALARAQETNPLIFRR